MGSMSKNKVTNYWGDEQTIYGHDNETTYKVHVDDEKYNAEQAVLNRDFQSAEAEKEREWSERMQDKQNAFNVEMFNKTNEYNTPSAQIQRGLQAGINPSFTANNLDNSSATQQQSSVAPSSPVPSGSAASISGTPHFSDPTDKIVKVMGAANDTARTVLDAAMKPYEVAQAKSQIAENNATAQNLASQTATTEMYRDAGFDKLKQEADLLASQKLKTDADVTQVRGLTSQIHHNIMNDYVKDAISIVMGKYNLSNNAQQFRLSLLEKVQEANQIADIRLKDIKLHGYDLSYAYGPQSTNKTNFSWGAENSHSSSDSFGWNAGAKLGFNYNAKASVGLASASAGINGELSGGVNGNNLTSKYQQQFNTNQDEFQFIQRQVNSDLLENVNALSTLHKVILSKDTPIHVTQRAFEQYNKLLDKLETSLTKEVSKTSFDLYQQTEDLNPVPFNNLR